MTFLSVKDLFKEIVISNKIRISEDVMDTVSIYVTLIETEPEFDTGQIRKMLIGHKN